MYNYWVGDWGPGELRLLLYLATYSICTSILYSRPPLGDPKSESLNPSPVAYIIYNTAKVSRLQALKELRPLLYLATYYNLPVSFNSSIHGPLPGAPNPGILFQFSIYYIITVRSGIRQWD